MVKRRRKPPDAPDGEKRRFYAFVESVGDIKPVLDHPRARFSFILDAVAADAFDDKPDAIRERANISVIRVQTTPGRLASMLRMGGGFASPEKIEEGQWLEITLQKGAKGNPRAWIFSPEIDFATRITSNLVAARVLNPEDSRTQSLADGCRLPDRRLVSGEDVAGLIQPFMGDPRLRIEALDVGQAACVAFHCCGRCVGYFDVGAPMHFNGKSFPARFDHRFARNGFVLLSHWDYDHFALARKQPALKSLDWYAPNQPVGPATARFQASLGARLNFITGEAHSGAVWLARGLSANPKDRNGSGYVLRLDLEDGALLLTGDADYCHIPAAMKTNLRALTAPHHTGGKSNPPSPARGGLAVASYGLPNCYHHPDEAQLERHRQARWTVVRMAATQLRQRGDRDIYPFRPLRRRRTRISPRPAVIVPAQA